MSQEQLNQLLQECLAGFDSGLSPEECLSAYPHARQELEPLLRQALSLRIAFATSPREEFRQAARERLLFAAGRDVKAVLNNQPDEDFVANARNRFMIAAGAPAQEALRAVPPPRLPFWSNARRRLLEAAAMPKPQPRFRPVLNFGHVTFAMRSGLTAAVVVVAVAIAGATFMAGNDLAGNGPRSASSADLQYLEQRLDQIDQMRAQGQPISSSALEELAKLTSQLAAQLESQPSAPIMSKLPDLIERQQEYQEAANNRDLLQAQQDLQQAEEKVKQAAAKATETATPQQPVTALTEPSPSATTPPSTATVPPSGTPQTPSATAGTAGTATPGPATPGVTQPQAGPLIDNQIVIRPELDDKTAELRWLSVQTNNISFVVPSDWTLRGFRETAAGRTMLDSKFLFIETGGSPRITIVVDMETGEVTALIGGAAVQLRGQGAEGKLIDPVELVEKTDDLSPALHHFLTSIELADDEEPEDDED
jgi:hypothetical protein